MKKLGVIILNWNGLKLLQEFIPIASRFTQGEEVDLIVADNGSTDSSVEWLRRNHPEVKVIELSKNYGFAEGYNRAIELAIDPSTGKPYPFILLLNSDVEVKEGWWQPLLSFMEANPDVGAAQPKIKSYRQRDMFEYAGAAGGYLDRLGYPYCRGRLFDSIEKDEGQYDGEPIDICWASGAALIVRTDLYRKLGGLDPKFFAHMEEIDLCCRMHAAGYRVCAISDSEVYHVGGASLNQGNPQKTYLNFRNNLLLLHKNLPKDIGKRKLFIRRLADTLAFFMFCAKFDFPNAKAILKAHSDFRKMRKDYTTYPDRDTLSALPGAQRNIIIDRYLLRKKK
ncbi:MAG: glycosyltransferase family 2 protein [Muribaculaceae bacterium]|nr:glycosyltransferase family 2 protein [Muribaculaceae bacterium]MDE6794272.1 glycosyltransferase family 2 protein [Muribaculaceae bacterium]